jgi:uncharacterized protein (TIGR02246 family)
MAATLPAVVFGVLSVAAPTFAQSLEEQVSAAYAVWDAAFNAGDAGAVAETYTKDALFLPATHDVITGQDDVGAFFAGLFDMGVTEHKLDLIEVREDGDAIIGAATWSATGKDADGADQPWGGLATHVFERQDDGSLKLMVHTFN